MRFFFFPSVHLLLNPLITHITVMTHWRSPPSPPAPFCFSKSLIFMDLLDMRWWVLFWENIDNLTTWPASILFLLHCFRASSTSSSSLRPSPLIYCCCCCCGPSLRRGPPALDTELCEAEQSIRREKQQAELQTNTAIACSLRSQPINRRAWRSL